jgi:hypothetical protein
MRNQAGDARQSRDTDRRGKAQRRGERFRRDVGFRFAMKVCTPEARRMFARTGSIQLTMAAIY